MSMLFTRPSLPRRPDFEIDRGSFGVYDALTGAQTGLVLGEGALAANSRYAATEHWILFPSYEPPAFNLGGTDVTVKICPIKPSAICSAWTQYDANGDVPSATFVSVVKAAHPGSIYIKTTGQLMP